MGIPRGNRVGPRRLHGLAVSYGPSRCLGEHSLPSGSVFELCRQCPSVFGVPTHFFFGPAGARALRARSAWRGRIIRVSHEYPRVCRSSVRRKENLLKQPSALASGPGSVQSPNCLCSLPMLCVAMPQLSQVLANGVSVAQPSRRRGVASGKI